MLSKIATEKLLACLTKLESLCCISGLGLMALLLFADVLLRTLLGNGLPWAQQSAVYANILVAMFGIGLAAASGAHLRPRFADNWLPTTWQPALAVLQPLVTAVIFFLFALLAIQLVAESYQLAERSTVLQTPVWPMQCLLPLAFLQAALRYGLYALHPSLQPIVGLVQE